MDALSTDEPIYISAATHVEVSVVISSRNDAELLRRFDDLLAEYRVQIVSLSREQALLGRYAFREFGRGSGHPARLNFGDCFSYALSADFREPLLCKGHDFSQTDLRVIAINREGN